MSIDGTVSTDLTFFTNEPGSTLRDRFIKTLKFVQFFDVLVGYFRSTGFHLLEEALEPVERIRILVGLDMDFESYEVIESYRTQTSMDTESHQKARERFEANVVREMDQSEDSFNVEKGVARFIKYLSSKKLEIRVVPDRNVHAKVYISRFGDDFPDFGRVITGSSNFSMAGLQDNREFNVELKNPADVKFALAQFEELWNESVDVSDEYVATVTKNTWLNDEITPYQLYLKFLYEYFKEDINNDRLSDWELPEGVMDLAYQRQAVVSAKKILAEHNGVFIADVVGLGKTYISAMLARQLGGRILVVCPPTIIKDWKQAMLQFGVPCRVESLGMLEHLQKDGTDEFKYVFVDEAHRFRNEMNQSYEQLHDICQGKKVVLISATPLNNTLDDIFNQLKLFQVPRKSTIPGVSDLGAFFSGLKLKLQIDRDSGEYEAAAAAAYQELRDKVLKYVMVRRTRTEITKYFRKDMDEQGLSFPEIADPVRIVYQFDDDIDRAFNQTMEKLKTFSYARYTPLLYLKRTPSELEAQSQKNIGGFMKGVLVKRLESSFFAFRKTLSRFIQSYENFINMFNDGNVYIGKKVNVFDLLAEDADDKILELIGSGKLRQFAAVDFRDDFVTILKQDLELLKQIQEIWAKVMEDPKLTEFTHNLKRNPILKDQKVLVFSESFETAKYLYESLNRTMPGEVMLFSSHGGEHAGQMLSVDAARETISANFDPKAKKQVSQIRILVATDVLAEAVNLHRSCVVVNYDLPWNPTRVLQRVGRVNRVGTRHQTIHVFNIFPTAQAEAQLGLEEAIKSKIQAFHDTLGEDARYLTDEEIISTHELFGEKLLAKLSSRESLEGEEDFGRSELEFLSVIRRIRDDDPSLFESVKRLPRKARSCRNIPAPASDGVVTFFRRGGIKKFFLASVCTSTELPFVDAAALFECSSSEPRVTIPSQYFSLLQENKDGFAHSVDSGIIDRSAAARGGNLGYLIKRLKSKEIRDCQRFTDDDEDFLKDFVQLLENGAVPKISCKKLKALIETEADPLKVLGLVKDNTSDFARSSKPLGRLAQKDVLEVVLSEYLVGSEVRT